MNRRNILKKGISIFLTLCILLAGCSKEPAAADHPDHTPGQKSPESQTDSSEGTMAARLESSSKETNEAKRVRVMGDSLYTASWSYDFEAMKQTDCQVSLQKSGGQAETIADFEEELITFLVGGDGAVYYLYRQDAGEDSPCFLRKDSADGNTEYCREIKADALENEDFTHLTDGAVGSGGEICFISAEGGVCLFSPEGEFLCSPQHTWSRPEGEKGAVNYGGELYLFELSEDRVSLWPLTFAEGAVGGREYLLTEKPPTAVFSGYEKGLYLADDRNLWNYLPGDRKGVSILRWDDGNVNLQPDYVEQLGILEDGGLFVLYWDTITDGYGQAVIRELAAAEVNTKETVILGIFRRGDKGEIKDAVKAFNRSNQEYQVELLEYKAYAEFYEDLLRRQGADLFELSGMPVQMLAGKGALEDLGPWFLQSESVQEEALLPCIREAGSVNDGLFCVIPKFYLRVLITEKGVTEAGGWTADGFMALGRSWPQSMLSEHSNNEPLLFLLNHLCVAIGNYVDWEKRECHFDDGAFAELLESVMAESRKQYTGENYITRADRLRNREVLTLTATIGSVTDYLAVKDAFADYAEIAGYPNAEGKPWYLMYMNQLYGMSSSAKCKAGAWAFLEFLLGEEYQEQTTYLPAVEAVLEKRLTEAQEPVVNDNFTVNVYNDYIDEKKELTEYPRFTDEDKALFKDMLANTHWDNSMEVQTIQDIIMEEVQPYFAGDKTAQDAAQLIQNRISLYLAE